jgi:hypothetical protein
MIMNVVDFWTSQRWVHLMSSAHIILRSTFPQLIAHCSSLIPPNYKQLFINKFDDPRSVTVTEGGKFLLTSSLFVVPEAYLDESKYLRPAIVQSRPPGFDHQGLVADVLSVGSRTRPEYVSIVQLPPIFILFISHFILIR